MHGTEPSGLLEKKRKNKNLTSNQSYRTYCRPHPLILLVWLAETMISGRGAYMQCTRFLRKYIIESVKVFFFLKTPPASQVLWAAGWLLIDLFAWTQRVRALLLLFTSFHASKLSISSLKVFIAARRAHCRTEWILLMHILIHARRSLGKRSPPF